MDFLTAPIYQITAGTINRLIKRQLTATEVPKMKSPVEDWPLFGKKLDMSSYLHWMDAVAAHWIEREKVT